MEQTKIQEKDIENLIKGDLLKSEKAIIGRTQFISQSLTNIIATTFRKDTITMQHKWYGAKNEGKEFGFYANHDIGHIIVLMKRLNLRNIVDLGCGPGITNICIASEIDDLCFTGYDNEKDYVKFANDTSKFGTFLEKDIVQLTREDIENAELLYMWEPIRDRDLSKVFVDNLVSIMNNEQIIAIKPVNHIIYWLKESKDVKHIGYFGSLRLFVKK